jgi:hypothetical protein
MTKLGHRQFLDSSQVKSSSGSNRDAWPLRVNANRDGAISSPTSLCSPEPVPVSAHAGYGLG